MGFFPSCCASLFSCFVLFSTPGLSLSLVPSMPFTGNVLTSSGIFTFNGHVVYLFRFRLFLRLQLICFLPFFLLLSLIVSVCLSWVIKRLFRLCCVHCHVFVFTASTGGFDLGYCFVSFRCLSCSFLIWNLVFDWF